VKIYACLYCEAAFEREDTADVPADVPVCPACALEIGDPPPPPAPPPRRFTLSGAAIGQMAKAAYTPLGSGARARGRGRGRK
jgi:hypothetical protein